MSRKPPGGGSRLSFTAGLLDLLEKFRRKDPNKFFESPVDIAEVPEYYEHIKNPMCFATMEQKINAGQYPDLESFKADFKLVCSNCKFFNAKQTIYYKAADALQRAGNTLFASCNFDLPEGTTATTATTTPRESPTLKREVTPRLKRESPSLRTRESPRRQNNEQQHDTSSSRAPSTPFASPAAIAPSSVYLTPQTHRIPEESYTTPVQPKREWHEAPSTGDSHHDQQHDYSRFKREEPDYDEKRRKTPKTVPVMRRQRDTMAERMRLSTKQVLGAGINFDVAQPPTNMDLYHLWQMEQFLQRATRQPAATRTIQHCAPSHTRVGPIMYDRHYRSLPELPYAERYLERARRYVKGMPSIAQELVEEKINLVTQVVRNADPEEAGFHVPARPLMNLVNDAEFKPIFQDDQPFGIPKADLEALGSLSELGIKLTLHDKLLLPPPKVEPEPEPEPAFIKQELKPVSLTSQSPFRSQDLSQHILSRSGYQTPGNSQQQFMRPQQMTPHHMQSQSQLAGQQMTSQQQQQQQHLSISPQHAQQHISPSQQQRHLSSQLSQLTSQLNSQQQHMPSSQQQQLSQQHMPSQPMTQQQLNQHMPTPQLTQQQLTQLTQQLQQHTNNRLGNPVYRTTPRHSPMKPTFGGMGPTTAATVATLTAAAAAAAAATGTATTTSAATLTAATAAAAAAAALVPPPLSSSSSGPASASSRFASRLPATLQHFSL